MYCIHQPLSLSKRIIKNIKNLKKTQNRKNLTKIKNLEHFKKPHNFNKTQNTNLSRSMATGGGRGRGDQAGQDFFGFIGSV